MEVLVSMDITKYCSNKDCKQLNPQPISNFHKNKYTKDGYRSRCKACELERANQYREHNRELLAQKQQKYYKEHGEVQRKSSRNWKESHKQRQQEYWQQWYEENKEHRAEYFRRYETDKPHIILEKGRRRRKRKLNAEGSFTEEEFQKKLKQMGNRCFWCGRDLKDGDVTRDHYIPLTKGGSDCIDNIVPACRSCNCKKRNKMPHEFVKLRLATLSRAV
jgi:5-methylcytosine-specific restriction endonuclease McrA